jgi:hypothetical protein
LRIFVPHRDEVIGDGAICIMMSYKITNPQMSKENVKEKEKLVAGPRWAPDTKTDWPTDCRS